MLSSPLAEGNENSRCFKFSRRELSEKVGSFTIGRVLGPYRSAVPYFTRYPVLSMKRLTSSNYKYNENLCMLRGVTAPLDKAFLFQRYRLLSTLSEIVLYAPRDSVDSIGECFESIESPFQKHPSGFSGEISKDTLVSYFQ